jgi:hypothetical protein
MKKFYFILIVSILLTACSSAASNNTRNRSNGSRTPVAQIQVQPNQSQSTADGQSPSVDSPSPTPLPLTATASPVPSATSTPAATADPSQATGLDVVSRQGYSMNDGFYIVGELLNNTSAPMGNIKITATYYYQMAGKYVELGTMDGATLLDVIPAYGKAPFIIGPYRLTTTRAGPVTWYDLHEQGQADTLPRQDLVVQQTTNSYSAGSWLYVRGEILNTGKTDAKFVKAIITLYDPDGNVVGAMSTYTDPSTIPAGGIAPFSVSTDYWPNFDHLTVQVQGQ